MNKKILMFAIMGMFLISFASATLTTKINEDYDLKVFCINNGYCSTTATCNTTIISPSTNTVIADNLLMENQISYHNLTINNASLNEVGEYKVTGVCVDGSLTEPIDFSFYVTLNGGDSDNKSQTLFLILFLIIVGSMLGLLLYTIFKMIEWDFDAKDLIICVSVYFTVFATYILSKQYLNNLFVDEFLVWLIGIGAFTTVILPIIAFFMNYVKGGLSSNE